MAEGILATAEQMQYPDGPDAGCLPDSFDLLNQRRRPAATSPCALIFLQQQLDGLPAGLAVAADSAHRVVAPFPVTIRAGKAIIRARRGMTYEVLIDGSRFVSIDSRGLDVLDLNPATFRSGPSGGTCPMVP